MLSFHNDPAVKLKYVLRTEAHREADNLIRGTGWNGSKGCAVGCTLEKYNHSQYPIELGIPEWLARVEDTLFEGMSHGRAMLWPSEFLMATPVGVTEEQFDRNVKAPFLVLVLESTLRTFDQAANPAVTAAVQRSIALWKRSDINSPAWLAEAEAAAAAARAAWAATEAARAAEAAAEAARAARAAARAATEAAAWAAARAAAEAAWAAAAEAAWAAATAEKCDAFADELLRLLKNAKETANG